MKAKRLRRLAENRTKGLPERRYENIRKPKVFIFQGRKIEYFNTTVRLAEDCTRHAYQALKKSDR
ncbi:MAG: hypothetical protein D6740_12900 [Alphaproteobacteria bacterium]|nr:MAG: hypothetical protein D6740_12900 [Alphaproteobacteria bacterium]